MCQLLESIRFENGRLYNLKLHEQRMEMAQKKIFGIKNKIDLAKIISIPKKLKQGRYKCRIIYDSEIRNVEFSLYKRKRITKIKLVLDDSISYSHKYLDRECIKKHTSGLDQGEEVIFVKKGLLRDASYSNIALYNGKEWHTPKYPLLKGTKRAELLASGILNAKMLRPKDIKNYSRICFITAMNDLGDLCLEL